VARKEHVVYADCDAENLLTIVKQQHLELMRQADRERLLRRPALPSRRWRAWLLHTLIDGAVRGGVWLQSHGVRKISLHAACFGASKTNKGVPACSSVK
jgi:hypothetical protein